MIFIFFWEGCDILRVNQSVIHDKRKPYLLNDLRETWNFQLISMKIASFFYKQIKNNNFPSHRLCSKAAVLSQINIASIFPSAQTFYMFCM